MKKLFALIVLCFGFIAHSPAVMGARQGDLSIDIPPPPPPPEIFRLSQAENDDCMGAGTIFNFSANNIQVREKWSLESSPPLGITLSLNDNGVLAFSGATDQDLQVVATVMVEDEFSLLSDDYQNLTAQAIITLDIVVPKIFISGGINNSIEGATWSSSNGINWQINNANSFPPRYYHTMSPLNGRLYVMGGSGNVIGTSNYNDVWSSRCGNTWQQDTPDAGWSKRYQHAVAVLQNTLFLAGGYSNGTKNDVWSTTDGTTWSPAKANNNTGWSKRYRHQMVSHQNTLYIIGGITAGNAILGDVWSSPNGTNWSLLTDSTPWSNRHLHQVVVHKQRLYLMGGRASRSGDTLSDVWSSEKGIHWERETDSMGGGGRYNFVAFSYNGRLYVMGGTSNNDVWSSADGQTWRRDTTNSGWPSQTGSAGAVFLPE